MAKVNPNYQKLPGSYLFSEIARRTAAYSEAHPETKLIKMGIGDVTRPLAPAVIEAMHAAVDDMANAETFHGYGPEQGYDFLRSVIAEKDFHTRGVDIADDEIFISDGAKSDCGNIGDILDVDNVGTKAARATRHPPLAETETTRSTFVAKVNPNYQKLPGSYLFSEIARRTAAYSEAHPETKLIKMGIGDVTRPLAPAVIEAMHAAVDDMANAETFHGYGPEQGYDFLRSVIAEKDFHTRGVDIADDEIFISDGAKSDCGNIGDILDVDNVIAVCDPVYPVYVDSNAMAGRAGDYDAEAERWTNITYMPTTAENGFCPALPEGRADVIYLCSPNNPTGTVLTAEQLKVWVDYANANGSIIMFDAAYERFITEEGVPHSIYEVEGAKTCAIEFRSFSKTAGFTGARCGYTVVPKELERDGQSLNAMWNRRQCTKFNGASYIIQRGAAAIYTEEGERQIEETLAYYRNNARVIKEGLEAAGFTVYGAVNSPYIWCKTPEGIGSWEFFDKLLTEANIITTPGAGFGPSGEGYVRLTAFGDADATVEAMERIKKLMA